MTNSGTSTWTSANNYGLGSQNPQDNTTWGLGRVALPSSVAPGAQVTFNFRVTAPSTSGTYNFQWRMVHDGVAWFGDYSPNVAVTDGSPSPTPTPTPPPNQVAPVTITATTGDASVSMSTTTAGATIFYTQNSNGFVTPTHNAGTPTGSTAIYKGSISVVGVKYFSALGYKAGMTDSGVSQYVADNVGGIPSQSATASSSNPRSVSYTLDKAGNRISIVDTGVSKSYSPNNLNQYTAAEGSTVGNGSEHEMASYQGISYTYINDERLKSVTSGSNNYQLTYDALGRCVKRTLNGVITYYVYDGEKPILEYKAGGAIAAKNLYGKAIDETLTRTDYTVTPNRVLYYQQDHEGSVTHLTDGSGNVIETYRYDAFGAPTINGGALTASALGNRFMFTGREYDSTFGIYEYRARAYHPGLGRFMSEDPKGFDAGDYNLFRYCHNDPEDLTDPMGLTVVGDFAAGIDESVTFGLALRMAEALNPGYSATIDRSSAAYRAANVGGIVAGVLNGKTEAKLGGKALSAAEKKAVEAMARGREAEKRVLKDLGETKNTTTVSGKEGKSIPDFINKKAIGDVKDTKRVTDSSQLRIQREAAEAQGKEHQIITGKNTNITPQGGEGSTVIRRSDLGPSLPDRRFMVLEPK
jgi:RHS repeat-associated protein